MANNETGMGVTGLLAWIPTEAVITDAQTPIVGATVLGLINEDGISIADNTSIEERRAWQGKTVVRTSTTDEYVEITCTLLQNTVEVEETFFGSTPVVTGGVRYVEWVLNKFKKGRLVVEYEDNQYGDESGVSGWWRYDFPDARVVSRGAINPTNSEMLGYEITIRAYPDTNLSVGGRWFETDANLV